MANFSKFHKYQTFGLTELHNLNKGQLADRTFKLWKSCVYNYRAVEHKTFEIPTFQKNFIKNFMKKNFQVS